MGKGKRKIRRRDKKVAKPRNLNKAKLWVIEGGKIVRPNHTCPKCGPGVFMAEHHDRRHCGKCGYTKMKGSGGEKPSMTADLDTKPQKKPAKPAKPQ